MKVRKLIAGVGGLAAVACSAEEPSDGPFMTLDGSVKKPNVVLINLDDSGFGDFSFNGAVGYTTPNVDRIAQYGLRMTNYYSAQPISGASRSALVTGCYSNRIGLTGAPMVNSPTGMSDDEQTIGELMQDNGYRTALIGKWHIGDSQQFLPPNHGFDVYFGTPYSNDMWPKHPTMKFPPLPMYDGLDVWKYIEEYDDMNQITTWYTERSIKFIKESVDADQPFFLYLAHNMPHVPLAVSDKFKGKSEAGLFGDVMMEVDWSIGEIMKTLEDLKIDDETLVIIISDNGPWSNYGNHAGSSGGFREGKSTTFNGGLRVPCLLYMPKHIRPGICNALISSIDFLPTIVDITGAQMPKLKIDGVDFIPYLTGQVEESPRDYLAFYFSSNSLEAVTDGEYKLVFPHMYNSYEVYAPGMDGQPGRTARMEITAPELYNLRQDPGERRNVYDANPEKVAELERFADSIKAELGDDLTGVVGTGRREPGRLPGAAGMRGYGMMRQRPNANNQ